MSTTAPGDRTAAAATLADMFTAVWATRALADTPPAPPRAALVGVFRELLDAGAIDAGPAAQPDARTCARAAAEALARGRYLAGAGATVEAAENAIALAHIAAGYRELAESLTRNPAMQPADNDQETTR
jgi:hypothetical protein